DHAHATLILEHEVHRGIAWVRAALRCDLAEGPAGERLEARILEGHEHDAFRRARGLVEVLPIPSRTSHLATNARALPIVPEARKRRAQPALVGPGREARAEAGRARLVRIHVGGDREATGASARDAIDDRVELVPVRSTGLLEVIDLRRQPRAARDLDDLVDCLGQRRPGDVVLDVALLLGLLATHGLVHRTERPSLAEDLAGHALADVALRAAVGDERRRRPAQHVDEARRDREPSCVDLATSARADLSDLRDAVAIDRDVAREGRTAGAVVDRATADDDVMCRAHRRNARD